MRKMKKIWKKLYTPLTFLPAVCIALLIFGFSAQTGEESSGLSSQVTEMLVRTADRIADAGWTEEEIQNRVDTYEIYVRKGAHMTEYAVLAISLFLPFKGCGWKGRRLVLTTFLICAVFAAGDEWHQSFVGGRGPSPVDVGIDCLGAGAGILLMGFGQWLRN